MSIVVSNIGEYIANKNARKYTHCKREHTGEWFYWVNDNWMPQEEFYRLHPIELKKINYKGANPDKTKV